LIVPQMGRKLSHQTQSLTLGANAQFELKWLDGGEGVFGTKFGVSFRFCQVAQRQVARD